MKIESLKLSYFIISLVFVQFCSCICAGTHGAIKSYNYHVTKRILQDALQKAIAISPNIWRDTFVNYYIDVSYGKKDTVLDNYYNDGDEYITVYISNGEIKNEYILKYGGNKKYWDTANTASIFIAYAHDKKGTGGSSGNGGVNWYNFKLKKELIESFERELISRIDSVLGQKHTKE